MQTENLPDSIPSKNLFPGVGYREEKQATHFQGMGIGLSIAYEIIQHHNGKIWVESEAGKGSTFYFTLPV